MSNLLWCTVVLCAVPDFDSAITGTYGGEGEREREKGREGRIPV